MNAYIGSSVKLHFTIVHQRGSARKFNRGWGVD